MTAPPQWHPDIVITQAEVKTILADQFPSLAPITAIQQVGEGWDNKVFLINDQLIFRFPRRQVAVKLIERENAVLGNLKTRFNLAIPDIQYKGRPSPVFPHPFNGYPRINGTSGTHAKLTMAERIASLAPLTHFLKTLHSIKAKEASAIGATHQVFDRTNVKHVVEWLNKRVQKINEKKLCKIDENKVQEACDKALSITLPMENKVLVHGDLYSHHLIFQNQQLIGIIDWGDVGINNPAVDLAVIFRFYPPECQAPFLDIYGPVDPHTWDYARFLGLYVALTGFLYGFDIGDPMLVEDAKTAIFNINPQIIVS